MIRIAIADDQQLFRESLHSLLASDREIDCVLQCENGSALLTALEEGSAMPDIVLLDLEMPVMNGIETHAMMQQKYPGMKCIILSMHANEKLIASLLKAGIDGYLTKNCGREELLHAIKMVAHQGYYINSATMHALKQSSHGKMKTLYNVNHIPIDLSKREAEVLKLICKEYSSAEIAEALFVSLRTVEGHRTNMIKKIGCKNSAGLVLFALRNSIYVPPF